ncbi:MAG: response regulator [Chitinophagales bacterium]
MYKILLIEDNPDVRENTAEILELAEYQVTTAANGKKGVALAKSYQPDLIICDIMMPELDGYGVLRILNKNMKTARIPFIFLTAKIDKTDIRKGMNLGADDYITKPFDETDLLEAIEMRIARSQRLKTEFKGSEEELNEFFNEARGLEALKQLSENRKTRTYNKKEVIFREHEHAHYLYFILKGKIKCFKTDDYGKNFVNDIYEDGGFMGYISMMKGSTYEETATAMTETTVALIPKKDFQQLIQANRDVAIQFIKMLSGEIQDKEKRLLQLAYAPVRERVAEALLNLTNNELTIEITREDFAEFVGTTKESLIRTLSEFKTENLIQTTGRKINIIDIKGLQNLITGF